MAENHTQMNESINKMQDTRMQNSFSFNR